jgi:hypothetical protein
MTMTSEKAIQLARSIADPYTLDPVSDDEMLIMLLPRELSRVYAAGAADEREACAKLCDEVGMFHEVSQGADLAFDMAAAIRARSTK